MLFLADNKPKEKKQSDCLSGLVVRTPSPHTMIEVYIELNLLIRAQIYIQFLRGQVIDIWFY